MKLATKHLGEVEVEEAKVLQFEHGIPGFEDEHQFVIIPFGEESPFFLLQSVRTPELSFIMTEPFSFFQDYDFQLDDASISELQLEDEKDVAVFAIITARDPFESSTANLQAPIIVNAKKQRGKQVVLHQSPYHTRHHLFAAVSSETKED